VAHEVLRTLRTVLEQLSSPQTASEVTQNANRSRTH